MVANFYEIQKTNVRKTAILISLMIIIALLAGIILDIAFETGFLITGVLLFFTIIQILISVFRGSEIVLKSVNAKKVDKNTEVYEEKQLLNIVEEISISSGVPQPEVYVMQDSSINAFATGIKPEKAYVCVTTGLLEKLNRDETTGVIAHEIAHIKNRDILVMTTVSALVGGILLLAIVCFRFGTSFFRIAAYSSMGRRRSTSKNDKGGAGILGLVLAIFVISGVMFIVGQISRLMTLAISRKREYLADATAIEFTRDPNMLSSALKKIYTNTSITKNSNGAIAHLFISEPKLRKLADKKGFLSNLLSTHPPLIDRIALIENRSTDEIIRDLK